MSLDPNSRRRGRSLPTILAAGLVTGLLAASCTMRIATPTSEPNDDPGPGERPVAKQYPDRPSQEVKDGLSALRACDLIDTNVLDKHGVDRESVGVPSAGTKTGTGITGECRTVDTSYFGAVKVALGARFEESGRYELNRIEISGFTAYHGDISLTADEWTCTVHIPVSFTRSVQFLVKAMIPEDNYNPCQTAKDLAASALPRITAAAGEDFLYRPADKDENADGACLHFLNLGTHKNCVPYRWTPIPRDPQDLVREAASDPRISCGAASSIVREVLGTALRPVVYGQSCVFVEPTHTFTVSVFMSDMYRAAEYDFGEESTPTNVDGHPAVVSDSTLSNGNRLERRYVIATSTDDAQHGVVSVTIQVGVTRGLSSYKHKADPSKVDDIDAVAQQLMQRYF